MNQHGASKPLGYKRISDHGYVLVKVGRGHRLAAPNGYAYEHRMVMKEKLGRPLPQNELVHHIDGDKQNNAPSNLELAGSIAEHKMHHRSETCRRKTPGEGNMLIECACGCGQTFYKYDDSGRERSFAGGHGRKGKTSKVQEEILCACGCGTRFLKYDNSKRARRYVSGHNARNPQ